MSAREVTDIRSPWSWWEGRRRLLYNFALIVALGLGGLVFLGSAITDMALRPLPVSPDGELPEITIFTVAFQGLASLAGLLAANILYTGGPVVEGLVPRAVRPVYRRWSYRLGTAFSVVLILSLPAVMMITTAASLLSS